jgi:hypothetical protein
MTGDRKCELVAYFAQEMEELGAEIEAWLVEFHAKVEVDEEVTA